MGWGEYEPVRVALNALREAGPFNPAVIGPALRPALESGQWRDWVHPVTGIRHFDDFDAFVEHETQHHVDVLVTALRPDHRFDDVVSAIESARRAGIEAALPGPGGRRQVSITHLQNQHDADAIIARLKRDDPALAEQVIAGTVTPHAAAKQAGIRRPRATFATNDAALAVAQLLRFYDKDEILTHLGAP